MPATHILAIETSFDDTAVAVLRDDQILASIVSTQIDVHKEWGGVVPHIARREHEKMIDGCVAVALKRSGMPDLAEYDAIAVTAGPGLAPSLEVGIRTAKALALEHNLPLIPINHMEGHVLSAFLKNKNGKTYSDAPEPEFPLMSVLVSGGHTEIVWAESIGEYEVIGQTLDDAAGEAFDKIGRMLDLGYPAGPVIAELAVGNDRHAFELPRPMHNSPDYNYSFSGLKTAALYNTNTLKEELGPAGFAKIIPDYCASVEETIVDALLIKVKRAAKKKQPKMVVFGGGVSANNRLRRRARAELEAMGIPTYFPSKRYCTDNAAMIGLAAYHSFHRGQMLKNKEIEALDRDPSISVDKTFAELQ